MRRALTLLLLVSFASVIPLLAQSDRATLTGTVSDTSGAVVPGATVTATNIQTKVGNTAITNDSGFYKILNLPVGEYSISYQKTGFELLVRRGIVLSVSQVAEVDVTLKLGAVAQTVEVTAAAPVLESQTNDLGGTVTLTAFRELPLSISGGRDIMAFAFTTTPGVEGNSWTTYIAGTQAFSNEVLIDGTLAQESETGQVLESEPPMEAVEEFRVDTGGMSGAAAMYTAGGTFSFNLKSGTNQLHGSAVEFIQNEALNANSWMDDYNAAADPSAAWEFKKPRSRHNDLAFSGGGPIKKNKTFIFGAFEQYRKADYTLGSYSQTVPTTDFLTGNFGALLDKSTQLGTDAGDNPIYKGAIIDPTTHLVFPNNVIPQNRFSKTSQQIVGLYQQYYKPLDSGLINNDPMTSTNNPWFHQTQFSIKMDHNFSEKNRLASSFIYAQRPRILDDQGGIWDPQDPNGGPLSHARMQEVSDAKYRISDTHTFSPSLLNVAAFTYEYFKNPSTATSAGGDWPSKLGFGNTGAGNFPDIKFASTNGVGESEIGNSDSGFYIDNNYIYDNTLTWIKGRHTLRFGGEFRAFEINSHGANGTLGFNFSNNQTGAPTQNWGNQVGFAFASFLLGDVASAGMGTPYDLYGRRKSTSLFAEDSFRVSSKLTLNLGLNWNQTYPFHEKYGHWANFDTAYKDPTTGAPGDVAYLSNGSQSYEGSIRWRDFAPHFGFAYKLKNRIVARGAYAMFYVPNGTDYWNGVPYGFAPGYFPTNQVPQTSNFAPAFNWDNGYPGKSASGALDPNYLNWTMVTMSPQSLLPGIVNQWNGGVELELTNDTRLSVNYLATRGTHLHDGSLQQDQGPLSGYTSFLQKDGGAHEWDWVWDQASAAASGVPYPYPGYSNYAFAALSPFPQISGAFDQLFYVGSPVGRSQYDSLQLELTHRTSHGLTTDMSYTFARQRATTISNFQESWGSWTDIQNLSDLSWDANYIQPYNQSIVKGYVLYTLPFGNGRRFVSGQNRWVNGLVSDWTLGSTLYYSTGTPLSVYSNSYYPGLSSAIYPNVASGADLSRHFTGSQFVPDQNNPAFAANNRYFSTAGFSNPAFGAFGNSGPYVAGLNTFGTASENVALYKDFKIKERMKLQLRGEFFNVFNRHYFDNPNTSLGSQYFGDVMTVGGSPRVGQLGVRFEW